MRVIDPLFDGPVDIVGDVHGEFAALEDLLLHLGYDGEGRHVGGRRLVFVGDLTDRGPDSPAVLQTVRRLVAAGRAQCIIGNHELNLLRGERKDGNDWWTVPDRVDAATMRPVSAADKTALTAFLRSLPLALERADLRVVHACWNASALVRLQDMAPGCESVVDAWRHYQAALGRRWSEPARAARLKSEWRELAPVHTDRDHRPRLLPTIARMDREYQMDNPVCVLTSGEEVETATPFWAGGKWRMVERVRWWMHYDDPIPVVIGHYWRRFSDARAVYSDKYGPDLFAGVESHHCMGPRNNVYCVDFSVGGRYAQRAANEPTHMCRLAALRIPEWQVVYDNGEAHKVDAADVHRDRASGLHAR